MKKYFFPATGQKIMLQIHATKTIVKISSFLKRRSGYKDICAILCKSDAVCTKFGAMELEPIKHGILWFHGFMAIHGF